MLNYKVLMIYENLSNLTYFLFSCHGQFVIFDTIGTLLKYRQQCIITANSSLFLFKFCIFIVELKIVDDKFKCSTIYYRFFCMVFFRPINC